MLLHNWGCPARSPSTMPQPQPGTVKKLQARFRLHPLDLIAFTFALRNPALFHSFGGSKISRTWEQPATIMFSTAFADGAACEAVSLRARKYWLMRVDCRCRTSVALNIAECCYYSQEIIMLNRKTQMFWAFQWGRTENKSVTGDVKILSDGASLMLLFFFFFFYLWDD